VENEVSGGGGSEPVPPSIDAGLAADFIPGAPNPGRPPQSGPVATGLSCFVGDVLPAGCSLPGVWRLLQSQPVGDCPFGASRQTILISELGGQVCVSLGEDFQRMQPGPSGACAILLSGQHDVPAGSPPYSEQWTSRLTFTGDAGSGQTQVIVSGGNNCARTFQTAVERL
jgi:hypothetical protein